MAYIFQNKQFDDKEKKTKNKSLFDFASADTLIKTNSNGSENENNKDVDNLNLNFEDEENKLFSADEIDKELKDKSLTENEYEIIPSDKIKGMMFPYDKVRSEQEGLILAADETFKNKTNLIAHAPTGLGKTVSILAPALTTAIAQEKHVLFLTSRHTQHLIAMKTARDIRDKFKIDFVATDIVGKKWMCINAAAKNANSRDFSEICKYLRENGGCQYYSNTRKNSNLTVLAKDVIHKIKKFINDSDRMVKIGMEAKMCPYELSLALSKESRLIITDYYYVFNESIMENFFKRSEIELSDCIIIVDEGHNLPARIREQKTARLSTIAIIRALKEAEKIKDDSMTQKILIVKDILESWGKELDEQREIFDYNRGENSDSPKKTYFDPEVLVRKEDFEVEVKRKTNYDELIEELKSVGQSIKDMNNAASYIFSIGEFLEKWKDTEEESFIRILKREKKNTLLSIRSMDPGITSRDIINRAHSTILMSGTLQPTSMYKDVLGFDDTRTKEMTFDNPFPKKNRLNLIIPKTTTKYEHRNIEQFSDIAKICVDIANEIPGNIIIFFPSYDILKKVYPEMRNLKKTVLLENSEMTKNEKAEVLEKFKSYYKTGCLLLGVQSGSFSEGIDLPGDQLKCVVIVGLPLQKPDLETRQLIKYYDIKFEKGWDYGYVFPAFSKILQSAGRCIRSATDRGAIIFLDERYSWPNYTRCFPEDWEFETTIEYLPKIKKFFNKE